MLVLVNMGSVTKKENTILVSLLREEWVNDATMVLGDKRRVRARQ